jgi:16S rRNA (guanine527-N7)-methyltransferase
MKGSGMGDRKLLENALMEMGIKHDRDQLKSLILYRDLLAEKNRQLNLIGHTDSTGIIRRHILDCLAPLSCRVGMDWDDKGISILDIGSGGGLPGVPLAIMLKKSGIFVLEKSMKKSAFLREVKESLSMDNLTVITGRAEELARETRWRERFQVVIARAVTRFNILLEISIPFCSINGKIVFYKSRKVFSEIEAMGRALDSLGGRMGELVEAEVPGLDEYRALLVIDKEKNTPGKFPRRFSQIKKRELQ